MNRLTIIGHLGKDSELRSTQQGKSVLSFSVAAKTGWGDRAQTLWWDVEVWGPRADKLKLSKGEKVYVRGELSQREYNGKIYWKVSAQDIELLSPRDRQAQGQPQASSSHGGGDPGYGEPPVDLDDIPF